MMYGNTARHFSLLKYVLRQYIEDAQTDIFQSKQLRFMIVLHHNHKAIGTIDLYDFDALNNRSGVGYTLISGVKKDMHLKQCIFYNSMHLTFKNKSIICSYPRKQ